MLKFFVLDSVTHAMDGLYAKRKDALDVMQYLQEDYPSGKWSVCEVLFGDAAVTDEFFHRNRLPQP